MNASSCARMLARWCFSRIRNGIKMIWRDYVVKPQEGVPPIAIFVGTTLYKRF